MLAAKRGGVYTGAASANDIEFWLVHDEKRPGTCCAPTDSGNGLVPSICVPLSKESHPLHEDGMITN